MRIFICQLNSAIMSARSAVASRKAPDNTPEPNLADAAEKASLVIRSLQARLQQRSPELAEENSEELERQLAQYFSKSVPLQRQPFLSDLRSRVVDAVAE